jgi:hypothetical protein
MAAVTGFVFRKRVTLDEDTSVNVNSTAASVSKRVGQLTINSRDRGVVPDHAGAVFQVRRHATPIDSEGSTTPASFPPVGGRRGVTYPVAAPLREVRHKHAPATLTPRPGPGLAVALVSRVVTHPDDSGPPPAPRKGRAASRSVCDTSESSDDERSDRRQPRVHRPRGWRSESMPLPVRMSLRMAASRTVLGHPARV